MLAIIARKQTRIGELLREKFVFQLVIRQRDQNILNLQGQILALQNNPLGNMADARRLPVLNLIAPILAKNKPYTGQEPPDDYLDRLIQSISFAQGYMTVLKMQMPEILMMLLSVIFIKLRWEENIYQFVPKTHITEMLILILQPLYVLR